MATLHPTPKSSEAVNQGPLVKVDEAPHSPGLPVEVPPAGGGDCSPTILGVDETVPPSTAAVPLVAAHTQRGRFTIVKLHAQGGQGQVSIARDEKLRRHVALKEIRPDYHGDAALRERFVSEAEITGQLEHPGIVPIYSLDEEIDGQPHYAMRFVEGRTFAEAIAAYYRQPTPLAFRNLLKRFVDICQTIAYAHSRAVIHRDLKPANVLLGEFGETLVLDWGLAKRMLVDDGSSLRRTGEEDEHTPMVRGQQKCSDGSLLAESEDCLTITGQVLGTPAYMSPEQAAGHSALVGPATDIYALGAILYELLTGRAPYQGKNAMELLVQVRTATPPAPSEVQRGLPRALEAVCRKAMARQVATRYSTAAEMGREVERWLADEPVHAYREPLATRLARWGRRHKPVVAGGAALLTTALFALAVGAWIISLEQAKTVLYEAQRRMYWKQLTTSSQETAELKKRLRELESKEQPPVK